MTTAVKPNFSQFMDLLLARLYEAQRENPEAMIDLNAIAADLREPVPEDWVVDAAKILQARDLADCMISYGACRARLTGLGMDFVENGRGTGIIQQYRQEPAQFFQHVNVTGTGNVVNAGTSQTGITQSSAIEQERPQVFHLLKEIQNRLNSDATLASAERQEFLNDLESLRQQMKKRGPNSSVVAALVASLSNVASIAGHVAMFIRVLNPSQGDQ